MGLCTKIAFANDTTKPSGLVRTTKIKVEEKEVNYEKNIYKWERYKSITVYIPNHKYKGMMQQAFKTWAKASKGNMGFRFVNSAMNTDIVCDFTPYFAGTNQLGVTHTTYSTYLKSRGVLEIQSAKITIAEKHPKTQKDLTEDEVYTTMLHEIGHAIGLQHTTDSENDSIMNPICYTKNDISQRDLKRLYDLYGWNYY